MKKIVLFLPAYNEEHNIISLLNRIQSLKIEYGLNLYVVVANDGSTDNTLKLLNEYNLTNPIEIIDVQPNQGLANAMRVGLLYAINNLKDDDVFIAMDADDSHSPFLIPRMINQVNEGSDIVIASRYQFGSRIKGLTLFRKITGAGAGIIFKVLVGIPNVRDYTCGYRAYRTELLKTAYKHFDHKLIEEKGFSCMAEILLKLSIFDPVIHELPMILRYDRKGGASKMNVSKTVRQTINLIFKYYKFKK